MNYKHIEYKVSASGKCRIISKGNCYNKLFENEKECHEYIQSLGTPIHSYRKLTNFEKTDYKKQIEEEFNVPFEDFIDILINQCYQDNDTYMKVLKTCKEKYYFYC